MQPSFSCQLCHGMRSRRIESDNNNHMRVRYNCRDRLRREMSIHMFGLKENSPTKFATSSWLKSQVPYVTYRIILVLHALSILCWKTYTESIQQDVKSSWITTFPSWTFILYCIYNMMALVLTSMEFFDDCLCNDDLSWYHKVCWLLHTIAFNGSVSCFVASLAFNITTDDDKTMKELTMIFTSDEINFSVVIGIVMIIDVFVNNVTIRLLHVIYPIVYYGAFFIFHIYRWGAGYTPTYVVTDYGTHPNIAIPYFFVVLFVLCPFIHILAYCIDTARWKVMITFVDRHRLSFIGATNGVQDIEVYDSHTMSEFQLECETSET